MKIFLWFWLATIVVACTFFVSGMLIRADEVARFERIEMARIAEKARSSVAMMEAGPFFDSPPFHMPPPPGSHPPGVPPSGGPPQDMSPPGLPFEKEFLFDDKLTLLSEGEPPQAAYELASSALVSGDPELSVWRKRPLAAVRVRAPSGRYYVAVAEIPGGAWRRFLELPGVEAFRLAAALLVSGLVCLLLARHFIKPLRVIRQAARRLAQGDLEARVKPLLGRRRDELAGLGEDFDEMARRIELLVQSQKRLMRDISHEIRSPLARLAVAVELARSGGDPRIGLDRVTREAERIDSMLSQILALFRLDECVRPPVLEPVGLEGMLSELCEDVRLEAGSKKVSIQLSGKLPGKVTGDAHLLRSAVENVVRNAVRYSPAGSAVEVALSRESGQAGPLARISIRDHGPGVGEKDLGHLFEPFYRAHEDRSRGTGGTGLGLAIALRAVRVHGGEIWAANHPEGGLMVSLEIPLV